MPNIDKYTRCSCEHIAAHHSVSLPGACRMGSCSCEGFCLVKGEKVVVMQPPETVRVVSRTPVTGGGDDPT